MWCSGWRNAPVVLLWRCGECGFGGRWVVGFLTSDPPHGCSRGQFSVPMHLQVCVHDTSRLCSLSGVALQQLIRAFVSAWVHMTLTYRIAVHCTRMNA
jgi:hypothetical protein